MSLPLAGLTVIALEQAVAAPFATRQLADLGARVIKIERAAGDFARGYDTTVRGEASYFVWLNRGKESLVLDLKDPDDFQVLAELAAEADVLIQNLAPGAVERLGLGPETALERNPRLIYVSISGYGQGGPYEHKKAYDLLVQCESGLLSVTGTPEEPAKVGVSIADISAGMYAYTGILTALINRGITGKGDVLEVSMLEAIGEWVTQPLYYSLYGGASPQRSGAHHASIAPYGPFEASDGTVFLAIQNEREWQRFTREVLRRPDLAEDPRFASNSLRVANREALHAAIRPAIAELTADGVSDLLDTHQIANARLRTLQEFAEHPQLQARERWREVASPVGTISALLPPVTSRAFEAVLGAVPALGEHTESIRAEVERRRNATTV